VRFFPGLGTEKNGFVTATKLGTNKIFVSATKNFAAATKRFVDRTKHFVVVTIFFCYFLFLTNVFVGTTKPFFSVGRPVTIFVYESKTRVTSNLVCVLGVTRRFHWSVSKSFHVNMFFSGTLQNIY